MEIECQKIMINFENSDIRLIFQRIFVSVENIFVSEVFANYLI